MHVRQHLHILVKYIRKQKCLWPSQKIECKEWFGVSSYSSPNLKYFIFGFQFHSTMYLASPVQVHNKLFACCAGILKKNKNWETTLLALQFDFNLFSNSANKHSPPTLVELLVFLGPYSPLSSGKISLETSCKYCLIFTNLSQGGGLMF